MFKSTLFIQHCNGKSKNRLDKTNGINVFCSTCSQVVPGKHPELDPALATEVAIVQVTEMVIARKLGAQEVRMMMAGRMFAVDFQD